MDRVIFLRKVIALSPYFCMLVGAAVGMGLDMRRRRLSLFRRGGWNFPTILDVAAFALNAALGAVFAAFVLVETIFSEVIRLDLFTWTLVACIAIGAFIWSEGRRQVQLQRPTGLVAGEWLILFGAFWLLQSFLLRAGTVSFLGVLLSGWRSGPIQESDVFFYRIFFGAMMATGGVVVAMVVPRFLKGEESHRVLERIAAQGEFVQTEWVPPTPECPRPERWQMLDPESAEIEVLELLRALIIAVKPELIVETGTFIGHSAIKIAEALKQNGFGKLITIEYDSAVFAKAKQNIDASGLGRWIEYRNASSLESTIEGEIDIFFSDSDVKIREQEVRKFLPQVKPRGLVLIHDASSHFKVVREGAFRLENEGLLSVVLLSTPRGLCLAQKREGRT